jgi:hypothetical protein
MEIEAWLKAACDDAERRGLPELKSLLETLARSTAALRAADREIRAANPAPRDPGPDVVGSPAGLLHPDLLEDE